LIFDSNLKLSTHNNTMKHAAPIFDERQKYPDYFFFTASTGQIIQHIFQLLWKKSPDRKISGFFHKFLIFLKLSYTFYKDQNPNYFYTKFSRKAFIWLYRCTYLQFQTIFNSIYYKSLSYTCYFLHWKWTYT